MTLSDYAKRKKMIVEKGLSRLFQHYSEHDTGTISAFRSERTSSENKKLSKELKAKLLALGLSVTPIQGVFIENYKSDNEVEVKEDSYFVVDIQDNGNLELELTKLGQAYDQDSVTYSKKGGEYYLIGTKEGSYPGIGTKEKLGSPMFSQTGEFMSRVNGRPFVFTSAPITESQMDQILLDFNIGGIYSIKKIAGK